MRSTTYVLAMNLRRLREEHGVSADLVARRAGIMRATYAAVEDGASILSERATVAIAALFGTSIEALTMMHEGCTALPLWAEHRPRITDTDSDLRWQVMVAIDAGELGICRAAEILGTHPYEMKRRMDDRSAKAALINSRR